VRIYVAGPYTLGSPEANVHAAIDAGEALLALGHHPFVPHLNHWWDQRHRHSHAAWLALDLAWLEVAEALLRLPGPSVGAEIECRRAKARGIPIYASIDDVPTRTPMAERVT
jgi:hypothetical protein